MRESFLQACAARELVTYCLLAILLAQCTGVSVVFYCPKSHDNRSNSLKRDFLGEQRLGDNSTI